MRIKFAVYGKFVQATISREGGGGVENVEEQLILDYPREPVSLNSANRLDSLTVDEMKSFILGVNRGSNRDNVDVYAHVNNMTDKEVFALILDKFLDILYNIFSKSLLYEEHAELLYDQELVRKEEKGFVRLIREDLYCYGENDVLRNLHLHLQLMNL